MDMDIKLSWRLPADPASIEKWWRSGQPCAVSLPLAPSPGKVFVCSGYIYPHPCEQLSDSLLLAPVHDLAISSQGGPGRNAWGRKPPPPPPPGGGGREGGGQLITLSNVLLVCSEFELEACSCGDNGLLCGEQALTSTCSFTKCQYVTVCQRVCLSTLCVHLCLYASQSVSLPVCPSVYIYVCLIPHLEGWGGGGGGGGDNKKLAQQNRFQHELRTFGGGSRGGGVGG